MESENVKWVAQFNGKDELEREIIKLGIRKENNLIFTYFDFDLIDAERVATSEEEAIIEIKRCWGSWETFLWLM
jgi:hypothetical protein